MRASVAVLAFTALVTGCASQWRPRPGAAPGDLAADRYRCTQESRTSFSGGGTGYAGLGAIIGSAIGAQASAQYLFDLCMESRGHIKLQPESVAAQPAPAPTAVNTATPPAVAQRPVDAPPGKIDPTTYYVPYPGADPVPIPPRGGPVTPEFTVRGPPPRAPAATPEVSGMKAASTYMRVAEQLAKAQGCEQPAAAMTAKGAGQESFIVACPNGDTIAMQCGGEGCRILR